MRLQEAGRLDLRDFMSFEVLVDARHPEIAGDGVQYEGQRFRAECRLAGMLYGQAFGVDVAFGDPILGDREVVAGDDLLAFAGIAAPELRVYPVETHLAEKLHAQGAMLLAVWTRSRSVPHAISICSAAGTPLPDRAHAMFNEICRLPVEPDGVAFAADTVHTSSARTSVTSARG